MGVAAAERALSAAGVAAGDLAGLAFATTTPPLAEEDLVPRLGGALGVAADARTLYAGRSTRAGTRALRGARDAAAFPALVVAADAPRAAPASPEGHAAGAGAAAVVLGPGTGTGAHLVGDAEVAADYPGTRFRRTGREETEGLGVTAYDRAAFARPTRAAVDLLGDDPNAPDPEAAAAFAVTAPDGDRSLRAARTVGLDADAVATPVATLGDTGAAGPLLGLAAALREGATPTLVVGWGSGAGADALLVDGLAPVEADLATDEELSYAAALRRCGEITRDEPPAGAARRCRCRRGGGHSQRATGSGRVAVQTAARSRSPGRRVSRLPRARRLRARSPSQRGRRRDGDRRLARRGAARVRSAGRARRGVRSRDRSVRARRRGSERPHAGRGREAGRRCRR
ncbi:hypothetical protein [Halobaculum halobium]|uniref:hypothetical protein n=1 Tax=Halobaculum halobium TaxID=3032281 RepID=UPI003D80F0FF